MGMFLCLAGGVALGYFGQGFINSAVAKVKSML